METAYLDRLFGQRPEPVGYLLKGRVAGTAEFTATVARIAAGGTVNDPVVVAAMREQIGPHPPAAVSCREREVLRLVAQGLSNLAIAQRLHLTVKTVDSHIRGIFKALDLPETTRTNRRVLAVLTYLAASPADRPRTSQNQGRPWMRTEFHILSDSPEGQGQP